MKLSKLLTAFAAAGLAMALGSAHASITFSFNPNGTGAVGAIAGAGLLDQAPGNTLAINGAGGGAALPAGTNLTNLFQANLGSVQAASTANLFSNGTGGRFFTFVASFTETVTSANTAGGFAVNTFSITGGTFKMCAQTALGNNLTGQGFSCAGNGILSGSVTGGSAVQSANLQNPVALDQAGTNDWPGVTTLTSQGSAQLSATISFVDANYFPDLMSGMSFVLAAINSSLITPYSQVDPSRAFSSNTVANADRPTNIGTVNGITGPDFIFQADANTSFDRAPIPEPGSLALAGLALSAAALMRRRKK